MEEGDSFRTFEKKGIQNVDTFALLPLSASTLTKTIGASTLTKTIGASTLTKTIEKSRADQLEVEVIDILTNREDSSDL